MPRWSAERRAGRRHRPVISGDPEIGPTARRATVRRSAPAPVGALPLSRRREAKRTTAYPAPQRIRAAKLGFFSPPFLSRPACQGDSLDADDPPQAVGYAITANGRALH